MVDWLSADHIGAKQLVRSLGRPRLASSVDQVLVTTAKPLFRLGCGERERSCPSRSATRRQLVHPETTSQVRNSGSSCRSKRSQWVAGTCRVTANNRNDTQYSAYPRQGRSCRKLLLLQGNIRPVRSKAILQNRAE